MPPVVLHTPAQTAFAPDGDASWPPFTPGGLGAKPELQPQVLRTAASSGLRLDTWPNFPVPAEPAAPQPTGFFQTVRNGLRALVGQPDPVKVRAKQLRKEVKEMSAQAKSLQKQLDAADKAYWKEHKRCQPSVLGFAWRMLAGPGWSDYPAFKPSPRLRALATRIVDIDAQAASLRGRAGAVRAQWHDLGLPGPAPTPREVLVPQNTLDSASGIVG